MVVLFPGGNYSTDCPLLYYAGLKFEYRGYEKVAISYGDLLKQHTSLDECIDDVKSAVLMQLQAYDLSKYDDIVFVSKSFGTVIAGWIEEKLCIEVRHIYLTPIKETLPYIQNEKNIIIVVAGTKDKQLDADILKQHCIKENICLKQIDGVGHRLEVLNDMDKNIEVLIEVLSLY
ncbi:hypothetical protein LL037_13090 [Clostridium estertheticum]|uniref:hypothetical protein n=1 Tax=Clostridium estertheticum TaxID=238834 RepID=UPI00227B7C48|nr:hypothetical protein [Clostridium estertheticum]WAG63429.1 hypothetical protein LL037_13090 [Clostridium estertheticum]